MKSCLGRRWDGDTTTTKKKKKKKKRRRRRRRRERRRNRRRVLGVVAPIADLHLVLKEEPLEGLRDKDVDFT